MSVVTLTRGEVPESQTEALRLEIRDFILSKNLGSIALFFLETYRPFIGVGGSLAIMAAPFGLTGRWSQILQDRGQIEMLIQELEASLVKEGAS